MCVWRATIVAAIGFLLAGCNSTIGRWQFGFGRASAVDVVQNQFLTPVRTPGRLVMRAYIAQIAITRLGEELPVSAATRRAFAEDVQRATERLTPLLYCIYTGERQIDALSENGLSVDRLAFPDRQCVSYNSLMLEYTRSIYDLARRLGDIESVRNFNRRIIGSVSLGALIGSTAGPAGAATGAVAGLTLNEAIDVLGDLIVDALSAGRTLTHFYRDIRDVEALLSRPLTGSRLAEGTAADRPLRTVGGAPIPSVRLRLGKSGCTRDLRRTAGTGRHNLLRQGGAGRERLQGAQAQERLPNWDADPCPAHPDRMSRTLTSPCRAAPRRYGARPPSADWTASGSRLPPSR